MNHLHDSDDFQESSHMGWIHHSLGQRKYAALGLRDSLPTQHLPVHPLVDQQPTLETCSTAIWLSSNSDFSSTTYHQRNTNSILKKQLWDSRCPNLASLTFTTVYRLNSSSLPTCTTVQSSTNPCRMVACLWMTSRLLGDRLSL